MAQNGQTHYKNLAAFAARFLKYVWPFWALCIKGLNHFCMYKYKLSLKDTLYSSCNHGYKAE